MKRFISLLLVVTVVFVLTGCGEKLTPPTVRVLRVGMECAYAPFNWQEDSESDTNLPIENVPGFYAEGFDVQVAKKLGEQLGVEVVIVKLSWGGLISALNEGQIDMIIAGMADTEVRKESVSFSTPYHLTEYAVLVNNDSEYVNATKLSDFAGASILGQKDTQYDVVIDQIPNVNHLPGVENVPNMITRLEQRTTDGIVIGYDTALAYLDSHPTFSIVRFEDGQGFDIGFTGSCIGIRKDDTALLEEVNEAINTITLDVLNRMYEEAQANMPR